MHSFLLSSISLSLVITANAKSHQISVGAKGAFTFTPNEITAVAGDTLEFRFYNPSGPHNVVSGDFSTPCLPKMGAFYSGDIQGDSDGEARFIVEVTSTDPIYFYCSEARHCQNGMVGVVNPPSGQGFQQYRTAARTVAQADEPDAVTGGTLRTGDGAGDANSSSSSASASASASASSSISSSALSGSTSSSAASSSQVTTTSTTGGSSTNSVNSLTSTASNVAGNTGVAGSGTPTSTPGATTTPNVGNGGRHSQGMVLGGVAALLGGFVALMA